MHTFAVPFLGILISAVASTIIGILWYSPYAFGSVWLRLSGVGALDTNESKRRVSRAYLLCFVSALVSSYILGVILQNLVLQSLADAAKVGFFLWLGFAATSLFIEFLFEIRQKPWALYAINAGYELVSLVIGASILYLFIA